MKPQVSQHFGECCQVTERGVTEPGLQADSHAGDLIPARQRRRAAVPRATLPLMVCHLHKPEICPYGHSLAVGMPQEISWMPCICGPAHEAESEGRGMGHLML